MGNSCNRFEELVSANKRKFVNEKIYRINNSKYLNNGLPTGINDNSPIWYSTEEGINFYRNKQVRPNSIEISFYLNTNNLFLINLADEDDNLNFSLLYDFMNILSISDEIKNQFEYNERNSITELDRKLFEEFIKQLEICEINDICGFYLGKSKYFYDDINPHIFHQEYILIANKQSEILTKIEKNTKKRKLNSDEPPNNKKKTGGRKFNNYAKRKRTKRKKYKKRKRTYKK